MGPRHLESMASAAPLLLASLVTLCAARGDVPRAHAVAFILLLFAWAAALEIAKRRATLRATRGAVRQKLETSVQRAVAMADTEDNLLDVAAQAIAQVLPGALAEVLLANETGTEIHLAAIAAPGAPGCPVEGASGCAALRTGQTQSFSCTDAIDLCPRLRARPGGAKPALCVPLAVMGRTIGVLHATTTVDRPFREDQIASLEGVATHLGSRLRMLQMVDELQRQATTDSLTGLPNRRSFEERAALTLHRQSPTVVAIADLDHFKKLNDTHGHAAGDHALRVFAESLRKSFGEKHDFVARLGGEEFAIVLPRASGEDVRAAFARARTTLADMIHRQGGIVFTASYGIALFPEHGSTVSELLGAADRALYAAKGSGRDRATIAGEAEPERRAEANVLRISAPPAGPATSSETAGVTSIRRGVA